jgi:hypothetical protein
MEKKRSLTTKEKSKKAYNQIVGMNLEIPIDAMERREK